jgi:hypothetical protein
MRPIVISRKSVRGQCSASIGAYVVVNPEGWFLTAHHIGQSWQDTVTDFQKTKQLVADRDAIVQEKSLPDKERNQRLKKAPRPFNDATEKCSLWMGIDGLLVEKWGGIAAIDLGLGKLKNHDPASVPTYPTFKDPTKDFDAGASLCRLGFPFHNIVPTFDATSDKFNLPAGSVPPPVFSSEGILSRFIEFQGGSPSPFQFPLRWIETSSPGLKGQSGGPIIDHEGTIWGIQSNTFSYPLGFEPDVPNGRPGQKVHQFLNVGRGVDVTTAIGLMRSQNVNFLSSAY